jgi:hypothetical protein
MLLTRLLMNAAGAFPLSLCHWPEMLVALDANTWHGSEWKIRSSRHDLPF